jgi:hypothetical protein
MNPEEFEKLKEGDIIRSGSGEAYIVTESYGDRKVVVRTLTATNPWEWELVWKSGGR